MACKFTQQFGSFLKENLISLDAMNTVLHAVDPSQNKLSQL